jgi:acetyl esterase
VRPTPLYQLLYYTSGDFSSDHESHRLFGNGYGLDLAFFDFMRPLVFQGEGALAKAAQQLKDARLESMPATIVVTAGFDVLRDSGRSLARRLERKGVPVTYLNYPSLTHGFLQWSGVVDDAERAAVDTARLFGTAIRSRLAI